MTKHTSFKKTDVEIAVRLKKNTFKKNRIKTGYQTFTTHRLTVPSGSRLALGGSKRSSLLQRTLLPTAWTPCALDRSSVQLQALEEASNPGQRWESLGSVVHSSKSSINTRRPDSREMPKPSAYIVLWLNLTSAASPPPVIPYLYHGAPVKQDEEGRNDRFNF